MPSDVELPNTDHNDLREATFEDTTTILARGKRIYAATDVLQLYLKKFENYACRWNISISPDKCFSVTYTRRKGT